MSDESSNEGGEEAMEVEAFAEEADEEEDRDNDDQVDDDGDDEMGEASEVARNHASALETLEEMPGDDEDDHDEDPVESSVSKPAQRGAFGGKVLNKGKKADVDELEADEDLAGEEVEADADGEEDNDGDDDDGDEVLAAVVLEDDDGEGDDQEVEEAVVEVAAVVKPKPSASSSSAPKKQPRKKAQNSKDGSKKNNIKGEDGKKSEGDGKKKKKKRKKKPPQVRDEELYGTVPPERLEAAADARAMLQETVPTLPVAIAESQVRSFGRIYIEPNMDHSPFATTVALFPVGFSCDRYEFSPVHGRILKMRCSILSGRAIKEKQKAGGHAISSELPNGPVFRVIWGQGVDEDVDDVDYPFEPSAHASPLKVSKGKTALPEEPVGSSVTTPGTGMRVKVRFDKNQYFRGTVVKVKDSSASKKKRKQVEILIRYDDGSSETALYPDPDISLLMPGM
jgi:hypothetical protein